MAEEKSSTLIVLAQTHPVALLRLQQSDGSWEYKDNLSDATGIDGITNSIRLALSTAMFGKRAQPDQRNLFTTMFVIKFLESAQTHHKEHPVCLKFAEDCKQDKEVSDPLDFDEALDALASAWELQKDWKTKAQGFVDSQKPGESWGDAAQKLVEKLNKKYAKSRTCKTCGLSYIQESCPACKSGASSGPLGKTEEGRTKWANVYAESGFSLNFKAETVPDLANTNFDELLQKIEGVNYASGGLGSTGVFLIQTGLGNFVAKAGSSNTPGEYFCSLIAPRLSIPAPSYRILNAKEGEALKDALKESKWTRTEDKLRASGLDKNVVTLMDFIAGKPFGTIVDVDKAFTGDTAEDVLGTIGRIIAFDLLTNNFDRIPYIWNNPGNSGNLIFKDLTHPVAIDNCLTTITNEDGLKKYVGLVKEAIADAKRNQVRGKHITSVRSHIQGIARFDIDLEGCAHIHSGVTTFVETLRDLISSEPDLWDNIRNQVETSFTETGHDVSKLGLERLDPTYLHIVTKALLAR